MPAPEPPATDLPEQGSVDVQTLEPHLRELADELTRVGDGECLYCYLLRMTQAFGCTMTSHIWTKRWIASHRRAPNWVLGWVSRNGGCCCDCEVVMNVFGKGRRSERHRRLQCDASYAAWCREAGW